MTLDLVETLMALYRDILRYDKRDNHDAISYGIGQKKHKSLSIIITFFLIGRVHNFDCLDFHKKKYHQ